MTKTNEVIKKQHISEFHHRDPETGITKRDFTYKIPQKPPITKPIIEKSIRNKKFKVQVDNKYIHLLINQNLTLSNKFTII